MLPTEQDQFFKLIADALGDYAKSPTEDELKFWWKGCKGLSIPDIERALRAHGESPDEGKRAPRPIDIIRKVNAGAKAGQQCAAQDMSGRCAYPGIFSDGTAGDGPWYCPWHREDHAGPDASRWIDISRNVSWPEAMEKRTTRMLAEGQRAPGVVNTAHAMALRTGARGNFAAFVPERLRSDAAE